MDTIAAISTVQAPSAIGILRITGEKTLSVMERVFHPLNGKSMGEQEPRRLICGTVLDREGRQIDSAMGVYFRGPNSYTGEDSAEIHCHGSPIVLQEGLQALFAAGARQAERGEFTRRGFLNGRMDLTQAEAVIDLIEAETAEAARNAVGQVEGVLRRQVEQIYEPLLAALSRFYAVVDYPDEDIEELETQQLRQTLLKARTTLEELLSTAERGKLLRSGVPAVILGRPNAGKSSLLNALLGYDRAIVTNIPGTTRDTVEEKVLCGQVLLHLSDTAGIRETEDAVEKLGVERALRTAAAADLALVVVDRSQPLNQEDHRVLSCAAGAKHVILVKNKCDLPAVEEELLSGHYDAQVFVSAKTGEGLKQLTETIEQMYPQGSGACGQILSNARQIQAVQIALDAIKRSLAALEDGLTPDAVLSDTEQALSALGELNGKSIRQELVDTIFSRFCVGK